MRLESARAKRTIPPVFAFLLSACGGDPSPDTGGGPVATLQVALDVDRLALPYTAVGSPVPAGVVTLTDVGGGGSNAGLDIEVDGPFSVDGFRGRLQPGDVRDLTVRYEGGTASPGLAIGELRIRVDGYGVRATLAAAVCDAALTPPPSWRRGEAEAVLPSLGGVARLTLPADAARGDAVGVIVHAGATWLHGHDRLADALARSGRDAVLVEAPPRMSSLSPAAVAVDAVCALYGAGLTAFPALGRVVVQTETALDLVDAPDALHLYGAEGPPSAPADVAAGMVLRAATEPGDPSHDALRGALAAAGIAIHEGLDDPGLRAGAVSIGVLDRTQSTLLQDDRLMERLLAASGLAPVPAAPPELLWTRWSGDGYAEVAWWDLAGPWRVEGSDDGRVWNRLTDTDLTEARVPARARIRVVRSDLADSATSATLGATGDTWLVVDGVERPSDAAGRVVAALPSGAWAVGNEGFAADLGPSRVVWLLGDADDATRTFDPAERAALTRHLDAGGTVVVSGANAAQHTDPAWLEETFGARWRYDVDAAQVGEWPLAPLYPDARPDALDGPTVLWTWPDGSAAAVARADGRAILLGFPLEALTDEHLAELLATLGG